MLEMHAPTIDMYGLSVTRTITLIKECLNCNVFKWSGRYFRQIRGLAMGQRLAPILAICFMSKVEEPVLARLPLMYCRYIDDCCIVTSTQSEMDECFNILNQQSQHIKLTREKPKDGWLAYLNTQINLSKGSFKVKWYRKASSKNIIMHAKSAHPTAAKRAIVRNMFRTASQKKPIDKPAPPTGDGATPPTAAAWLRLRLPAVADVWIVVTTRISVVEGCHLKTNNLSCVVVFVQMLGR
ncbi:hypothetical protein Y032_0475g2123 [Ancylostoma ceylanicum]|nr:hypothetical protein Y032_0475g2123 [Ancylostoma ceylanicum]